MSQGNKGKDYGSWWAERWPEILSTIANTFMPAAMGSACTPIGPILWLCTKVQWTDTDIHGNSAVVYGYLCMKYTPLYTLCKCISPPATLTNKTWDSSAARLVKQITDGRLNIRPWTSITMEIPKPNMQN